MASLPRNTFIRAVGTRSCRSGWRGECPPWRATRGWRATAEAKCHKWPSETLSLYKAGAFREILQVTPSPPLSSVLSKLRCHLKASRGHWHTTRTRSRLWPGEPRRFSLPCFGSLLASGWTLHASAMQPLCCLYPGSSLLCTLLDIHCAILNMATIHLHVALYLKLTAICRKLEHLSTPAWHGLVPPCQAHHAHWRWLCPAICSATPHISPPEAGDDAIKLVPAQRWLACRSKRAPPDAEADSLHAEIDHSKAMRIL